MKESNKCLLLLLIGSSLSSSNSDDVTLKFPPPKNEGECRFKYLFFKSSSSLCIILYYLIFFLIIRLDILERLRCQNLKGKVGITTKHQKCQKCHLVHWWWHGSCNSHRRQNLQRFNFSMKFSDSMRPILSPESSWENNYGCLTGQIYKIEEKNLLDLLFGVKKLVIFRKCIV